MRIPSHPKKKQTTCGGANYFRQECMPTHPFRTEREMDGARSFIHFGSVKPVGDWEETKFEVQDNQRFMRSHPEPQKQERGEGGVPGVSLSVGGQSPWMIIPGY